MKRIAAITMVRNDSFFLRRWVDYYGSRLGMENLYVFLDGMDQEIPSWCPGVNVIPHERVAGNVARNDKGRILLMSGKARELLQEYDLVIGTDADEMLVVDPFLGMSLPEYLSSLDIDVTVSGLGVDMGQRLGEEPDLDESAPFLGQRRYARLCTRYTKASVIAKPVEWGSGFHRVKGHNFHIAKDLYLFHFGYCDMKRIQDRFSDKDRLATGWERHLRKRSRTIRECTSLPAVDLDRWKGFARRCQSLLRPLYAWNKPAMLGIKLIVRIPERFNGIV